MTALIECVPNVSEGSRPEVIRALAATFDAYPEVHLLHRHSDPDHNRSVFTLVGPPRELLDAVFELYERAVEVIDLRLHRGVHPRVGAVDVCPFVPLPEHGSDLAICRDVARRLGLAVAERFGLPVFLYRESAQVPERRHLAAIRRGQFEGLRDKLAESGWQPDFGPAEPHPTAGATIIGARPVLVAFNVLLDSKDLTVARDIAASVRESSGGLPGVRAMGVPLSSRDCVQVSMNIERHDLTPVHEVVEAVRREAEQRGVRVRESELIGLLPRTAAAVGAERLLLPELRRDEVLEDAIGAALAGRG